MMGYYSLWYPVQWLPHFQSFGDLDPHLEKHMQWVAATSKRLAREIFHQMMKYQKKLEAKQSILNRVVDIGTELFAISASCSYAHYLSRVEKRDNAIELAELFCASSRQRVYALFKQSCCNHDRLSLKVAKKILAKEFEWLENGIIK